MRTGELLGERFSIEALAAQGGMGAVYRARDERTGGSVAIKVVSTQGGAGLERFQSEAAILARLEHPAIVRHVAHGFAVDGRPFLAMEWLEGEDLAARLARGALSVAEALVLAGRVSDGLAHAHAHGVVHRDVKPSNLFLPEGRVDRAVVLDFGVARGAERAHHRTSTGALVGSVGYMAPEQARGERGVDARADVFSLGAVLFECLTGQPAFPGDSAVAVLAKILVGDPARVRDVRAGVPAALDRLVARMLARDPRARPADAAAVREALAEASGDATMASLAPPRDRSLTTSEQRFVSVLLAPPPLAADAIAGAATEAASEAPSEERARAAAALAPFGARIDALRDGTVVATLSERAVPTDLAAQAARAAAALRDGLDGRAVAIATGPAVLGGALPVGEVVDRAAALLRGAARGAILVDDVTSGLLEGRFAVSGPPGRRELGGERDAPTAERALLGKALPCVGRDRELAALDAAFRQAASEPIASIMLFVGAPGIGKSRVIHEFLKKRADATVLVAMADPMRAGSPFAMLADLVRRACGVQVGDGAAERRSKLSAKVAGRVAPEDADRVAVFLAEIIGAPFPPDHGPELRAARADAKAMSREIRRAFEDLLAAECRDDGLPVVLVLEDLHWGDAQTVSTILGALRRLEDRPLFVIGTARPEVRALFPELFIEAGVQHVQLGELTRKASERLVREVLGDGVPAGARAAICDRAGGNAFYLEELLVGSSRVDLQACKLEYSIVSPK